ncbi:MAG TPA: DUF5399 family protein [Chlamydiales bacterium]|nr:DUF5399 family protein [Chlamydiales bacterium]
MTAKPRTIDNLGVEASIRYAKDQQLFESRYIEESRLIPQKTEIVSITPAAVTEFDKRYSVGVEKRVSWALFPSLPQDLVPGRALFSYQLIPSLGSFEKSESDTDKLETIEDLLKKPKKRKKALSDREKEEEEGEIQCLMTLFKTLNALDKMLQLINGRRNQYQKG